jgi:hypothetical protein
MSKAKLKLVEPSLQDQLEATITLAEKLRNAHSKAANAFTEDYPGDRRLIDGDLAGTVMADGATDPFHHATMHEPKRVRYQREREKLAGLDREARDAEKAIEILRARIEASATEDERRVALAAAISEEEKAEGALHKHRAAIARADGAVTAAQERHAVAEKAVAAATEDQARTFEAALEQGHSPVHDDTVRDARRHLVEAADDLAVAKAAAATIRGKSGDAQYRLEQARKGVVTCAENVAVAGLPNLFEQVRQMQRDLEGKRMVLQLLNRVVSNRITNSVDHDQEIDSFLSAPVFPFVWSGGREEDHPAVSPWIEAIAALRTDAKAPLPVN